MEDKRGLSTMRTCLVLASLVVLLGALPLAAQQSASYRVEESSVNSGGSAGSALSSANYQITLGSLGEAAATQVVLVSPGYENEPGLIASNAPAGDVPNLRLSGAGALAWDPASSAASYNVYRGFVDELDLGYGTCLESGLTNPVTTDASSPASGRSFFYLVSASNRLAEEGSAGLSSSALQRIPDGCQGVNP